MNKSKTILIQMQQFIPRFHFEKLVSEHKTDKNVRSFTTWNLLQVMMYAQLDLKKSLRDICMSLESNINRWYHLGLRSISRNNLSNSLMKRSSEVFEKTFYILLEKVQRAKCNSADKRFKFKNPLVAIDSTTISLCLSLFDWASFRTTKGGIKVHTLYDIKNQIPNFMVITEAKVNDHKAIPLIPFEKGSIYVLDRGYLCLKNLENINEIGGFFVTRTKSNTLYRVIKKNEIAGKGILKDCLIRFTGVKASDYPESVRLVRFENPEDGKVYDYITNNFSLSASTIASIYKSRWDIELFFKWIKQNLRVKTFIGTSENALRIQLWTAAIVYLLLEYIRFVSQTVFSITEVFRILSSNILSDGEIFKLLTKRKRPLFEKNNIFEFQLDFGF
jgi:hypothetical protein